MRVIDRLRGQAEGWRCALQQIHRQQSGTAGLLPDCSLYVDCSLALPDCCRLQSGTAGLLLDECCALHAALRASVCRITHTWAYTQAHIHIATHICTQCNTHMDISTSTYTHCNTHIHHVTHTYIYMGISTSFCTHCSTHAHARSQLCARTRTTHARGHERAHAGTHTWGGTVHFILVCDMHLVKASGPAECGQGVSLM